MTSIQEFDQQVTALLEDRQLLTHAFYRRWSAGTLAAAELTSYAEQYRHFERALPGMLAATLAQPLPARARGLLESNLADETGAGGGTPHLALFDRFAAAVGAEDTPATPATGHLVQTYETASSPLDALGVLVAYESQAADIAASKAAGLMQYGVTGADAAFWTEHAEVDVAHRRWAIEALYELAGGSVEPAVAALRRGADAWWAFLDEREAAAPRAA